MTYRVEPCFGGGSGQPAPPEDATIVLVGCGGTGAFLAEAVCRLLIGRRGSLHVIDPDRVAEHNLARQLFDGDDLGRFKAQVVAERLARRFRRVVGYSTLPYDAQLHGHVFGEAGGGLRILLGCVDNAAARRAIAATLDQRQWYVGQPGTASCWWIDCGNGRNSGQVLLGNATRRQALRRAFDPERAVCRALPAPSLQRPDLLDAPPRSKLRLDCAEAIAEAQQGPTINQVIAALAASFVEKLLAGTCAWMAAYCDMDDGTLRCLPADPKTVAAAVGLRTSSVAAPRSRAA